MLGFVYCWTDHKENKLYVGSHKGTTNDGYICSSKYVLEQIGIRPTDFTRQIISEGEWEDMRVLESAILRSVDAKNNSDYYNQHNNAPEFCLKAHTEATKRKIGKANKGRKTALGRQLTEETKKKIGQSNKSKIRSDELKLRISNTKKGCIGTFLGKKHTEESKQKMSQSAKKRPSSRKGVNLSEETKQKISNSCKGRIAWNKGLTKNREQPNGE